MIHSDSLIKAIRDDPDRFIRPLQDDRSIVDFFTFQKAFINLYRDDRNNALRQIVDDTEAQKDLFRSQLIQGTIKQNVGDEGLAEANALVGGIKKTEAQRTLPVTTATVTKPIRVVYIRRGKRIAYRRSTPRKFKKVEERFIERRKLAGKTPKQIFNEYSQMHNFPARTKSSVSTKFYRL